LSIFLAADPVRKLVTEIIDDALDKGRAADMIIFSILSAFITKALLAPAVPSARFSILSSHTTHFG
jgi:hypothetical protein